jgi:hypothetical protein
LASHALRIRTVTGTNKSGAWQPTSQTLCKKLSELRKRHAEESDQHEKNMQNEFVDAKN